MKNKNKLIIKIIFFSLNLLNLFSKEIINPYDYENKYYGNDKKKYKKRSREDELCEKILKNKCNPC